MINSKYLTPVPFSERIAKESEFFSKTFAMSFSGLNKLILSPALFYYHYVLEKRDDSQSKDMIEGSLIHCLLLNPEDFDDKYILLLESSPTDSQKEVLKRLFEYHKNLKETDPEHTKEHLSEYTLAIEDILEDMNLYQSMKPLTRLAKIINNQTEDYWEYLKKAEGKIVIDHELYEYANTIVDNITNNPSIMQKMGFFSTELENTEKYNELNLIMVNDSYPFVLRGIIDNLVIDHDKKEIRINDLKKTSKALSSFPESIEYYNYWLQGFIYKELVKNMYSKKYPDYDITFRFIVADQYMQVGSFKISEATMAEWGKKAEAKLEKAVYHFDNKDFSAPYEILRDGELEL